MKEVVAIDYLYNFRCTNDDNESFLVRSLVEIPYRVGDYIDFSGETDAKVAKGEITGIDPQRNFESAYGEPDKVNWLHIHVNIQFELDNEEY